MLHQKYVFSLVLVFWNFAWTALLKNKQWDEPNRLNNSISFVIFKVFEGKRYVGPEIDVWVRTEHFSLCNFIYGIFMLFSLKRFDLLL